MANTGEKLRAWVEGSALTAILEHDRKASARFRALLAEPRCEACKAISRWRNLNRSATDGTIRCEDCHLDHLHSVDPFLADLDAPDESPN